MILARRRQDLKDQGLLVPVKFGKHIECDEWTPAFQPDELDDREFNLILLGSDGEVKDIAISIDFEYKEATK